MEIVRQHGREAGIAHGGLCSQNLSKTRGGVGEEEVSLKGVPVVLSAVPACTRLALQGRQRMAVPAGRAFRATRPSLQIWLLLLHFIMQMHIVYLTLRSY